MLPACVLRPSGTGATTYALCCPDSRDSTARLLDHIGGHMVHTGFAVRFALVREMCDVVDVGGRYCLVFRCGKATESNHVRRYIQSGLAKVRDAPVGYEVLPLTPGLQRRLG